MGERQYQEKLKRMRHQHEIENQLLMAQFNYQTSNLQHQHQLQQHLNITNEIRISVCSKHVISKQRERVAEQMAALDQRSELINSVRNKEKNREKTGAVASNAVKQHLQKFVKCRQKFKDSHPSMERLLHISPGGNYLACFTYVVTHRSPLQWTPSLEGKNGGHEVPAHYSSLLHTQYDFPLRKTASEPNLKLKSRLKQKLLEDRVERSSPLMPRRGDIKADLANRIKKKINIENVNEQRNSHNSAPNSGPSSPPNSSNDIKQSTPHMQTEFYNQQTDYYEESNSSGNHDLYSSPSLPNISIGLTNKKSTDRSMLVVSEELSKRGTRGSSLSDPMIQSDKPLFQSHDRTVAAIINKTFLVYVFMHQHFTAKLHEIDLTQAVQANLLPPHKTVLHGTYHLCTQASTPPGPIRHSQTTRQHKALSRTQSAPTAASQLQLHILQLKRRQKMLQQQQKKGLMHGVAEVDSHSYSILPTHLETEDGEQWVKRNQYSHAQSTPNQPFIPSNKIASTQAQLVASKPEIPDSMLPMFINKHSGSSFYNKPTQEEGGIAGTRHLPPQSTIPIHSQPSSLSDQNKPRLLRTQSSPATSFIKKLPHFKKYRYTTGIAYSPVMLKHGCACRDDHTEHAGRLRAIWERLTKSKLVNDPSCGGTSGKSSCELLEARKATTDELQLVHTQEHTLRYGTTSLARKELGEKLLCQELTSKFIVLPCGGVGVDNGIDIDTVWNELDTINAARMAVGCTVDITLEVAQNRLKNGFALVRPPGHHAQKDLAMAFCYFNSVAVAARKLQHECPDTVRRVLIVDWDVHHCNGTQNIFFDDPSVLVISIHRYDSGNFFPGTGAINECGRGGGLGYNVNIGFSGGLDPPMEDADYLAVFRTIVLPIARQFDPHFVLVSCGFSAANGHPSTLGGYKLTPNCYGLLTRLLSEVAGGKIVLVLEGGFELEPLCDCTEACVRTLLGNHEYSNLSMESMERRPSKNAIDTIKNVITIQEKHW
uniref:Histone deacetylase n=1 Tax=Ciona intestinalis TaxID=7719 RepID=F6R4S6_CIOIN